MNGVTDWLAGLARLGTDDLRRISRLVDLLTVADRASADTARVIEAEGDDYGVCWTLSQETAVFFATQHCRFRNTRSPPVILSATVRRDDIFGLLVNRNEREVLVWLGALKGVTRAELDDEGRP